MLFMEIIDVYFENQTKPVSRPIRVQNSECKSYRALDKLRLRSVKEYIPWSMLKKIPQTNSTNNHLCTENKLICNGNMYMEARQMFR
jgi:hypothetical protein